MCSRKDIKFQRVYERACLHFAMCVCIIFDEETDGDAERVSRCSVDLLTGAVSGH